MARYPFEEHTLVLWVPDHDSIADLAAPTEAELTDAAVVDITCYLTRDGLNPGGDTAKVGSGSLCRRVVGQTVGSITYDASLKGFRDNEDDGDVLWDLANWSDPGHLVIRRGLLHSVAVQDGQKVEVYKAQFGEPVMDGSSADTEQQFTVALAVEDAEIKAVVGGGS